MTTSLTTGPIPTWIRVPGADGFPDAGVHGVLEAPRSGRARFGVVLVAPVGREQVVSVRALVALSHELALRGAAVLRITLRGTGDSHPAPENLHEAWHQDVMAAVGELGRRAPGVPLKAVGLRIGAAVLGSAAATHQVPVRQGILWEPVGGRAYLRKAAALRRMSVARPVADPALGTETSGELYTPAQADALKRFKDPGTGPLPDGWSVRTEQDRGSAELLYEVSSEFARVPRSSVQQIALDLAEPRGCAESAVDLQPLETMELVHAGSTVVERLVVTDAGSPGIFTAAPGDATPARTAARTADGTQDASGHAVFMVSAAAEPMDGPTGLWTACARDLAAAGLTVLRTDRPRCGVLADPLDDDPPIPYEQAAINAVRADIAWLARHTGAPVTGVGLCVGSWLLMKAGEACGLQRVIAFNNIAWRTGTTHYQRVYTKIAGWDGAPAALAATQQPEPGTPHDDAAHSSLLVHAAHLPRRLKGWLSLAKDTLENNAPARLWHLMGYTGLVDAPSLVLDQTDVPGLELVQGREDLLRFHQLNGTWAASRAQRRRGRGGAGVGPESGAAHREILLTRHRSGEVLSQASGLVVRSVPELDHALLSAAARVAVRSILLELLVGAGSAFGEADRSRHGQPGTTDRDPSDPLQGAAGTRATII